MQPEGRAARRHVVHDAMVGHARHLHGEDIVLDLHAVPGGQPAAPWRTLRVDGVVRGDLRELGARRADQLRGDRLHRGLHDDLLVEHAFFGARCGHQHQTCDGGKRNSNSVHGSGHFSVRVRAGSTNSSAPNIACSTDGRPTGINLLDYGCIRIFPSKFVGGVVVVLHQDSEFHVGRHLDLTEHLADRVHLTDGIGDGCVDDVNEKNATVAARNALIERGIMRFVSHTAPLNAVTPVCACT